MTSDRFSLSLKVQQMLRLMFNIILADAGKHAQFKPLSWTRPVADLRTGILTSKERWERLLDQQCSVLTEDYLSEKWPLKSEKNNLVINAAVLPDKALVERISNLKNGRLTKNGEVIAAICPENELTTCMQTAESGEEYEGEVLILHHPWDMFTHAGSMIKLDFELLTKDRRSQPLSKTNTVLGENPVFVEPGASVEASVLNTANGPIYIGNDAEIMESCSIRGPFAMQEHAVLKMGAKVYGPTVLGPWVKAGGELNNVIFQSFSSKAHDGFLGNAVIGEWCNIGADSNNSNLKNNYAEVKMWEYHQQRFVKTGLQFCGLIMGDHSKCGINMMFNTGTVVGVSCNLFGQGFPRNFVPSFSWGGANGYTEYKPVKAYQVADKVMHRRNQNLTDADKNILDYVYHETIAYRKF
jgi:UDP-N-acetylglucosamine diphosphorylase/glucosamine-1-phosphate N-acetyltransferase